MAFQGGHVLFGPLQQAAITGMLKYVDQRFNDHRPAIRRLVLFPVGYKPEQPAPARLQHFNPSGSLVERHQGSHRPSHAKGIVVLLAVVGGAVRSEIAVPLLSRSCAGRSLHTQKFSLVIFAYQKNAS